MATQFALETVPTCVLCGEPSSRLLFEVPPYGYRACTTCGLLRLSPRVAASDLERLYDESYRDVYEGNSVPRDKQLANPTFDFRARRLTRHSKGRRFLEVGCGDGSFLAVLRSHGWDVTGREVSETAAKVIRERHGIDVEVSFFEDVGSVPSPPARSIQSIAKSRVDGRVAAPESGTSYHVKKNGVKRRCEGFRGLSRPGGPRD
jgi:hypothetical protein